MFNDILIVCIGNICRSPMGEALMARALGARAGGAVRSAGLGAVVGHPADETAQELMREQGLDISAHRARQLTDALTRQADLILVMESGHKKAVESLDPSARGKVYRLGEWGRFDVLDPYQQDRAAFGQVLRLIQRGVADWSSRLTNAEQGR